MRVNLILDSRDYNLWLNPSISEMLNTRQRYLKRNNARKRRNCEAEDLSVCTSVTKEDRMSEDTPPVFLRGIGRTRKAHRMSLIPMKWVKIE
jgi:hypothetical protein